MEFDKELNSLCTKLEVVSYVHNINNHPGDAEKHIPEGPSHLAAKIDTLFGVLLAYGKEVGFDINPLNGKVHFPDLEVILQWATKYNERNQPPEQLGREC